MRLGRLFLAALLGASPLEAAAAFSNNIPIIRQTGAAVHGETLALPAAAPIPALAQDAVLHAPIPLLASALHIPAPLSLAAVDRPAAYAAVAGGDESEQQAALNAGRERFDLAQALPSRDDLAVDAAVPGAVPPSGLARAGGPRSGWLTETFVSPVREFVPFLRGDRGWIKRHAADAGQVSKIHSAVRAAGALSGVMMAAPAAMVSPTGNPLIDAAWSAAALVIGAAIGTGLGHLLYNGLVRPALNAVFPGLHLPALSVNPAVSELDDETVADLIGRMLGEEVESAAADGHNVGWKLAKDRALADPGNPFIGWGPKRVRVSAEIKALSREQLSARLGAEISADKHNAILAAPDGQDITHPLYKPYPDMLADQPDGGMRLGGQNAMPLLVLSFYLRDFRWADTRTKPGLRRVLRGLIDGSDRRGIEDVSRLLHVAFQSAQLVHGERSFPNTIKIPGAGKTVEIGARVDFKSFYALHPETAALDEYTLLPAARWLYQRAGGDTAEAAIAHEFEGLMGIGPGRIRELRIARVSAQVPALRAQSERFQSEFAQTLKIVKAILPETNDQPGKAAAAQKRSAAFWALIDRLGLRNLSAADSTTLFLAFKDAGLFADMVKLYDQSAVGKFKSAASNREFLGVALHKTGDLARSEQVIEALRLKTGSGETYAILGKIHKLKSQAFEKAGRPREAAAAMADSVAALETGFQKDFEFYPGINLVYNMMSQAATAGDAGSFQAAERLARMVGVAVDKAGGLRSSDFWALATALEAAVIAGRDELIDQALPSVIAKAAAEWEIHAPIENLRRLRGQVRAFGGALPDGGSRLARLDRVLAALEARAADLGAPVEPPAQSVLPLRADQARKLLELGFSYGEIKSNFVGGNVEFGGQLHSHVVNTWDIDVVRATLHFLGLDVPKADFSVFNQRVDELIRGRFKTDRLERLNTKEHDEFDDFMKSLLGVMGARKGGDTRTNIMVDFWLGKGDCRQHAFVKQLFFDVWKTDRINRMMREAFARLKDGKISAYEAAMAAVRAAERQHMLVFDSSVRGRIAKLDKYKPLMKDVNGVLRPLLAAESSAIEDHTWNGLIQLDEKGRLAEFRMVDSFYHGVYRFGGVNDGQAGVVVPNALIAPDGTISVPTPVQVYDPAGGQLKEITVEMVPAAYSGNRDKRVKANNDEYGQVLLRGIEIDGLPKAEDGRPEVRAFFDPTLSTALEDFAVRLQKESAAAIMALLRKSIGHLSVVGNERPAAEYWRADLERILSGAGIITPGIVDDALGMVSVAEAPMKDMKIFRLATRGSLGSDPHSLAALSVAAQTGTMIAPSDADAWPELDALIQRALESVSPGKRSSVEDIESVRSHLQIAPVDSAGRTRYFLRLAQAS